jgi:hypothetical protein
MPFGKGNTVRKERWAQCWPHTKNTITAHAGSAKKNGAIVAE